MVAPWVKRRRVAEAKAKSDTAAEVAAAQQLAADAAAAVEDRSKRGCRS